MQTKTKTFLTFVFTAAVLGQPVHSSKAEPLSDHHQHMPEHVVLYSGISANSSNTFAAATAGSTVVYDTTIPREYEIFPYPGHGAQVICELIS